jgi:glycosyltransferase involved in cell wall biosynthesis
MAMPVALNGAEYSAPVRIGIDARLIGAFGIGSYVRGLLAGLDSLDRGPEEYVVFVPPSSAHLVPASFQSVVTEVPVYTLRELPLMGRLVARAKLDLVHVPHFVVPWTRTRLVTTLFDAIPFHYPLPQRLAAPYITWMMQRAVHKSARVLTISHAAKRDLLQALDCDSEKMTVVHIGVDEKFFGAEGKRASGRYFLFVGQGAATHKNMRTLLDAFARARRSDPGLQLVLAGGNHERFAHLDGVVVPGYVPEEDLLALYRGAIAVVLVSFMEGFGLPPLEGMAVGTPAITSTADALVEVTRDAALHVDPRSAEELAEAMLRLASDDALRAELGRRGREHARDFTWRRCAEATRDVYRELLR